MKWTKLFLLPGGIVLCTFFTSCSSSKKTAYDSYYDVSGNRPVPTMVYYPEYYKYKNGKYTFVRGHYLRLIGRKDYYKRMMQGYTYKQSKNFGYARESKGNKSSN